MCKDGEKTFLKKKEHIETSDLFTIKVFLTLTYTKITSQ